MEKQLIEIIEEDFARRKALWTNQLLERVAKTYDLPLERLIKDFGSDGGHFCSGILKSKKRCLKTPQENGYCKFHQSQVPQVPRSVERVETPW